MSETRRFDDLTTTVARTQQALDDKTTTLAGRLASHTHLAEAGATAATPVAGYRVEGDTKNRLTVLADGTLAWASGADDPDVLLRRTAANVLALDSADSLEVRGARVHEQPFARYYCNVNPTGNPSGQSIPADGTPKSIPFDVAQDTHPAVTQSTDFRSFTLNVPGVWRVSGGYRLRTAATGVHQLMVYNGTSSTARYGETQQNPGSGNHLSIERRFPSGAVVALGIAIVGTSGTRASPSTSPSPRTSH